MVSLLGNIWKATSGSLPDGERAAGFESRAAGIAEQIDVDAGAVAGAETLAGFDDE